MDEIVGVLSEGKVVLQISVLFGVFFTVVAWAIFDYLGLLVTSVQKSYLFVSGFSLMFGLTFIAHFVWHNRRSTGSD